MHVLIDLNALTAVQSLRVLLGFDRVRLSGYREFVCVLFLLPKGKGKTPHFYAYLEWIA